MSPSTSTTDVVAENTPVSHVRISLEPPTRPYAAATALAPGVSDSARTSFTQIDQEDDHLQPESDDPSPIAVLPTMPEQDSQPDIPQVPQTPLTFLLISGRRRTMHFAPEHTIGRVKELVWNAWPEDWKDDRPPAPSYLRILYMGKLLQDDETLTRLKLPTTLSTSTPTIMHISIRPCAPPNEQDGFKKKRARGRSDSVSAVSGSLGDEDAAAGGGGCCGCVIC